MGLPAYLSEQDGSAIVKVRLRPRAHRDEIAGERAGALVVRVTAPPVDGRANVALCRLLARAVGIARTRVELVRGASSREKLVRLRALDAGTAAGRLP